MSEDVVPSFHTHLRVAGQSGWDPPALRNDRLRPGEVKSVIYPDDPRSRSKRFVEYDVLVHHRDPGATAQRMYHNCLLMDHFGGQADHTFWTLRADQPVGAPTTGGPAELGSGSRVLVMCLSANEAEVVIVGGIRDERTSDQDRRSRGHHLEWEFNGVRVDVRDDGSFQIERRGPTDAAGKLDAQKVPLEDVGTAVEVRKDGTFEVRTRDGKQSVVIDHTAGTITVTGDKDLTLRAQTIHLGDQADEPAVLGDSLVDLLGQWLDANASETHPAPGGTTGPPSNASRYRQIKAKLRQALSEHQFVKKKP